MTRARLPLSVFIIAHNEADRIGRTIASVRDWVAEVVVVDSGSTDGTMDVAQSAGATTVAYRAWEGYGPQKRYAESLCTQPWVLNLDADEEVSPTLQRSIAELFSNGEPPAAAYKVDVVQVFPGEKHPRPFSPNSEVVRLYRRDTATFRDSPVHDSVILHRTGEIPSTAPVLAGPVWHHSFRNLAHVVEKINRYSSMQAEDMLARGKTVASWRIAAEPFYAFVKNYFFRRYFLMGSLGVVYSVIYACSRTLRLAKLRELEQLKRRS